MTALSPPNGAAGLTGTILRVAFLIADGAGLQKIGTSSG
jgi:hypothetical protein